MANTDQLSRRAEREDALDVGYLYRVVLVAAVGGFLFGYDLSLISGAILFLKKEFLLNAEWRGVVVGSAILGCPFGPLAGVWLADTLGRKRTLLLATLLFVVSTLGCMAAPDKYQLIAWRFIGGMGVGLASTVSPMYIAELAPPRLRGRLVMIYQLAVGIGLGLSVLVTYWLSDGGHWRWMFGTQGIPTFCLALGLLLVPESPRWLAAVGRHAEALWVLARINGQTRAERELEEIRAELGEETGGFAELLRPGVRAAVIIGIILMVFSQINGVNMIILYTPTLLVEAGLKPALGVTAESVAIGNSVILCGWILLCTVIAFWLIRTFSRRSILIVGTIAMAVGHLLMFLSYHYHWPTVLTLAVMFVPVGAFDLTLAPLSWVVISEFFPNRIRGKAMSMATCAMFAASFVTVYLFSVVMDWFDQRFGNLGGMFLIFLCICLACTVFVWRTVPETKDKTLEEISEFWLRRGRKQS